MAIPLVLLCAGCVTLSRRYPSRPPAAMTATQAEQDERACVATAGRATVERAWAYIGCMVSKEHTVGVAFHVRGEKTYFDVTQTRPHDPPVVASELNDCRLVAYAAGRSEGGPTGEEMVDRMESAFRACADPRGYVVQRQGAAVANRPPR
jgi:hypothetical protein